MTPVDTTDSNRAEPPRRTGAAGAGPALATLSRDLANFLIEFSIALHKHAMYPSGHPSLKPATEGLATRLIDLMEDRATISIGVAADQIVIGGVATDAKNAVLSDLARRLHKHHLGAIGFAKGIALPDLEQFLELVSVDPDRGGKPLGFASEEEGDALRHIDLYPVAYDQLQLLHEEEKDEEEQALVGYFGQLWVGLATAALGPGAVSDDDDPLTRSAADVAEAITSRDEDTAYDEVIVGYLLQMADELRAIGGPDALAAKRRMTKLISKLDDATLQRLLTMGGDTGQRRRFLVNSAQGMEVIAVLELVRAAGTVEGGSLSQCMLRMLQKLGRYADADPGKQSRYADQTLRDQIVQMVQGWALKDPNPDGYSIALQGVAAANTPLFSIAGDAVHRPDPRRVVQLALEVDVTGTTVVDAMKNLFATNQGEWLMNLLKSEKSSATAEEMWSSYAASEQLDQMLRQDHIDAELLDRVVSDLGMDAAEPMLEKLTTSDARQVRRVLLDRLIALGPAIAPLALAKLADSRWYVTRNMLTIIGGLPEIPEGFDPAQFFQHPDSRVRRESLRVMFQLPHARERGICHALADDDERTVRLALGAAGDSCPKAAVPLVVSRAKTGKSVDVRVAAIRVLGHCKESSALTTLIGLTQPVKKFFRWKLPPKSPEFLAALDALRQSSHDERVQTIRQTALRSRDPEIVAAAKEGVRPDA